MLLPADDLKQRIGRSMFFLVGAVFSAVTGYVGMWLAVRSNVRVAAAAREATPAEGEPAADLTAVSHRAMKIAFRTGGVVGMFTVGLGLLGAASSYSSTRPTHPRCWRASVSEPRCSRCS